MQYINVLRREVEDTIKYDIKINHYVVAENLSKLDAWDWLDEFTEDCDCKCSDYEITFGWA